MISKIELQEIYKKVDINKFFSHYNAKIDSIAGNRIRMKCILPGHNDSSPSAGFDVKKGLYNCFVCGGRNLFTLVKDLENLSTFEDAVDFVKNMIGYSSDDVGHINLSLNILNNLQNEIYDEKNKVFTEIDLPKYNEFESADKHFSKVKKRISSKMIKIWNIKYAVSGYYEGRLIIPIEMNKKVLSFVARDMTGKANKWLRILSQAKKDRLTVSEISDLKEKYECKKILYPPVIDDLQEKHENIIYGSAIKYLLFNFDNARKNKDYVILVEGVFDCMRLHLWGFNCVALCGTKLSNNNRELLLKTFDTIYIALDNDVKNDKKNAGQESSEKIIEQLIDKVQIYNILLPPNKDPDECTFDEFKILFENSSKNNDILS